MTAFVQECCGRNCAIILLRRKYLFFFVFRIVMFLYVHREKKNGLLLEENTRSYSVKQIGEILVYKAARIVNRFSWAILLMRNVLWRQLWAGNSLWGLYLEMNNKKEDNFWEICFTVAVIQYLQFFKISKRTKCIFFEMGYGTVFD